MLNIVKSNNNCVHSALIRMTTSEGFRMQRQKRLDVIPTVPVILALVIGLRQRYVLHGLSVLFLY